MKIQSVARRTGRNSETSLKESSNLSSEKSCSALDVNIVRYFALQQYDRDVLAIRIREYQKLGYKVQVQYSNTRKEYDPLWVETVLEGGQLVRQVKYYLRSELAERSRTCNAEPSIHTAHPRHPF